MRGARARAGSGVRRCRRRAARDRTAATAPLRWSGGRSARRLPAGRGCSRRCAARAARGGPRRSACRSSRRPRRAPAPASRRRGRARVPSRSSGPRPRPTSPAPSSGSSPVAQGDQLRSHCCSLRNVSSGRRADPRHGAGARTGRRRTATRRVREQTPKGLARPAPGGRRTPPTASEQATAEGSEPAGTLPAHRRSPARRPRRPSRCRARYLRRRRPRCKAGRPGAYGALPPPSPAEPPPAVADSDDGAAARVPANAASTGEALMPAGPTDAGQAGRALDVSGGSGSGAGETRRGRCGRRFGHRRGRDAG